MLLSRSRIWASLSIFWVWKLLILKRVSLYVKGSIAWIFCLTQVSLTQNPSQLPLILPSSYTMILVQLTLTFLLIEG